jgi:hypothetical protein
MERLRLCAGLMVLVISGMSLAVINVGPYVFDDNAFPDAALYIAGGPPTLSFVTSGDINTDLLIAANPDPGSYIYGTPVRFRLQFVDNRIVNDAGADLVLFELGTDDAAELSILNLNVWTAAQNYVMTPTGFNVGGFSLNAVAINLDDFGVPAMGLVEYIELFNTGTGGTTISSSICAVGALNSVVPEPATLLMLALGGVVIRKR